jgi:adenine phosphoribosyltransferase
MAGRHIDLAGCIRCVPDWPKPGILFRDITPLLADPKAFKAAIEALCHDFPKGTIDCVAAVEARGFIFGSAVAERLETGLVPIRKKGKLPFQTCHITYDLEYGTDTLEVHTDAVRKGARVLLVDDLLATGGTMRAACNLIEKVGGVVAGATFVIELMELGGRAKLAGRKVSAAITC